MILRIKNKRLLGLIVLVAAIVFVPELFAENFANLPGNDESGKLEAAGTLLRLIDTGLFKWGARLFAGLCIMSGAWALKEQRFGMAVICIIGAIVFGTAPTWVKNIFSISTDESIFSHLNQKEKVETVWLDTTRLNKEREIGLVKPLILPSWILPS